MPINSPLCANPRWQRRKDARPAEIIQAALQLFVEKGFTSTKLDEVAQQAGVTKGTLYLYFPSKEELFKAVVREAMLPNLIEAESITASFTGSMRELLTFLIKGWWQRMTDAGTTGVLKLVIAEAGNFPELAQFYHQEVVSRARKLFSDILSKGMAQGEFRAIDMTYATRAVMAPVILAAIWRHSLAAFEAEPFHFKSYIDQHIDIFLNGIVTKEAT